MKKLSTELTTPIYLRCDGPEDWPEAESAFYVMAANGLFLCRNHPFFRSCVPARRWPTELAPQFRLLDIEQHPRVPRILMERIVAFFDVVATRHRAEAAVLLLWDRRSGRMTASIPPQRATVVASTQGGRYPTDVRYEVPPLPPHVALVGDVHSHVDGAAYSSYTDRTDESYRAGLHIVVGRIHREPPEIHAEFVVDGERFPVYPPEILEGYHERSESVPGAWLDRVEIDLVRPGFPGGRDDHGRSGGNGKGRRGGYSGSTAREPRPRGRRGTRDRSRRDRN